MKRKENQSVAYKDVQDLKQWLSEHMAAKQNLISLKQELRIDMATKQDLEDMTVIFDVKLRSAFQDFREEINSMFTDFRSKILGYIADFAGEIQTNREERLIMGVTRPCFNEHRF